MDYGLDVKDYNYEQREFIYHFLDLVIESFVLKKFKRFEDIPVKEFCLNLIENKSCYFFSRLGTSYYKKKNLIVLSYCCSSALEVFKTKHNINDLIRQFYFEQMRDKIFRMRTEYPFEKTILDENGLPVETPSKLREYLVSLFTLFDTITEAKPEKDYISELPIVSEIAKHNLMDWKIVEALQRIILEKAHKGINWFAFFFFRIPEQDRILQFPFITKTFRRLCYIEGENIILLNDDINSLDFKLAVFDLIPFIDEDNKILWDNKLMQYRHDYVAKTIEDAFLAEIKTRFGL